MAPALPLSGNSMPSNPKPLPDSAASPPWLVFVDRADDDGPLLRMMVLNPLNGAMCALIDVPVEADAQIDVAELS